MWRRAGWGAKQDEGFTATRGEPVVRRSLPAFRHSAKWYTAYTESAMSAGESVIVRNPKILSGTPVFRGTRVPLQLLFDSLERGHALEEFLAGYPTVSREMAIAALEEAQHLLSAKS